jgi:hypothetical protein
MSPGKRGAAKANTVLAVKPAKETRKALFQNERLLILPLSICEKKGVKTIKLGKNDRATKSRIGRDGRA